MLILSIVFGVTGCSGSNEGEVKVDKGPDGNAVEAGDENGEHVFSRTIDTVKKTGSDGVTWLQETANGAAESGGKIAQDASGWATETFNTLKEQGLTSAKSTSDWVSEDFNNINAWEYKVLPIPVADLEASEEKLNELGKLRWECFHVATTVDQTIFYFKKRKRSYMRNLPMRDMLKLVPLMGNGGEN